MVGHTHSRSLKFLVPVFLISTAATFLLFLAFESKFTKIKEVGSPSPRSRYLYPKPWPLVDLPLQYLVNNDVCEGAGSLDLLMLVTSHAGNLKRREKIRQELSASELRDLGIRRLFLLAKIEPEAGQSKYHNVDFKEIEAENAANGDLLVGNFRESYRNLTYKHLMGLDWASHYCSRAKFILKQDDDVFVDLYGLLQHLRHTPLGSNLLTSQAIFGKILTNKPVIRDPGSKWFVKYSEFRRTVYPPFVSGWAYVTTPRAISSLVKAANELKYFWIDDVHITGTLRKLTGITILDASLFFATHSDYLECCLSVKRREEAEKYWCDFIIGPDESNQRPNVRPQLLKQSQHCYKTQGCSIRAESDSLLKKCVIAGKVRKKVIFGLPREKGKPVLEPLGPLLKLH